MFDFKFSWSVELETGIDNIDNQHKELLRIGREVEQLIITNCENLTIDELYNVICELRNYATYHYYYEEELMRKIQYKDIERHSEMHRNAISYINNIDPEKIKNNPIKEVKDIKTWIQNYVFEHIMFEDKELALKIKESNII